MEFMPQNAPLVVLTFLGTCFAFGFLGIAVVYGLVRGKPALVKYVLAAALAGVRRSAADGFLGQPGEGARPRRTEVFL